MLYKLLNLCNGCRCTHALYAEPSHSGRVAREKLGEIFFEKFDLLVTFLCMSAVLFAHVNACTASVVLDIGHSYTSAVPVL